jgi:transcriptional regulator with GAF, ATPase, and Fis domain
LPRVADKGDMNPQPRSSQALRAESSPAQRAILGQDAALRAEIDRAGLVAPTHTPVLVGGESGTGKELVARLLHELGPNPGGPFVAVNCGALPRELAESELFGHERGAFTGAGARRAGWFEEASGGTLVLDEIGELPLELQPKLLRVLETGRLRRVGGAGEIGVRVRVVAMTLRDLDAEVRRKTFRADLFYRLSGFRIHLPPLRERRGDVALLAEAFLAEIAGEVGPRHLEASALAALAAASWPGNVRELRNVIRRAAILTGGRADGRIDADVLELPEPPPFRLADAAPADPSDAGDWRPPAPPPPPPDTIALRGRSLRDIERDVFQWALDQNGGSRRRAARALSVARSTFCDKVRRYGL